MQTPQDKIDTFFDAYARRFNESLTAKGPDVESTARAFAPCFIEASPLGVNCGKNDTAFREAIPKGVAFYKSIGTQSMHILSKQVTALDDCHSLVKVRWHSIYRKRDGNQETIDFDIHYFLQDKDGELKIFAYITGDEQKVLKERGLLPAE